MSIRNRFTALAACLALVCVASTARAQVGEPLGSFNITVQQGATVIANKLVTVGPGQDLSDLKATFQDGTPESFTQIGTAPGGSPIILKLTTDDDPNFRIAHWYVDVPGSLADIYTSSGGSLVNPINPAPISVTITGLTFAGTTSVTPLIVGNDTFLTEFMRDTYQGNGGRFYNQSHGTYFGPGVLSAEPQVQVAGKWFTDADTSQYTFAGSNGLPNASWTWGAIPNPGPASTTVSSGNPANPTDGRVYELGLSVAFVGVPEPGTLGLIIPGMLMLMKRRRK